MVGRFIALALAGVASVICQPEKASAFEKTQPMLLALAKPLPPMPRSRTQKAAVYELAALPSGGDEIQILPAPLPRMRADLGDFRLVKPPIDIRVTAPPAGIAEQRWGRSAPRKPDNYAAATFCLAKAIYYEARSEPLAGRLAVGRVIMNRMKSRFYPNSVCEVVYQNAHMRNRCQFSFACDGKADIPRHMRAWNDAVKLSEQLLCRSGQACKPMVVGGKINISTHYHATYVKPRWSKVLPRTGQIGQHIFYFTASR